MGHGSVGLLLAQVGIGILTYRYRLQVEPLTVAHQMVGAALLACLLAFTVLAWQMRTQREEARWMAVTAEMTGE